MTHSPGSLDRVLRVPLRGEGGNTAAYRQLLSSAAGASVPSWFLQPAVSAGPLSFIVHPGITLVEMCASVSAGCLADVCIDDSLADTCMRHCGWPRLWFRYFEWIFETEALTHTLVTHW